MDKKSKRIRRAKRTRGKIKELGVYRLSVHRTPKHIYAQVISPEGTTVASANTLQKDLMADVSYSGNADAAMIVGKNIALKAKEAGIDKVAFDRSGYKYHGRIKSLADAARESGLNF